jgi:hypothetical protein
MFAECHHAANHRNRDCVLTETNRISYAAGPRDATGGRRRGRSNRHRRPQSVTKTAGAAEILLIGGRVCLCRRASPRRIKSTWDLWPLAAETAKEPMSRAGILHD